jgi:hypothetical protein
MNNVDEVVNYEVVNYKDVTRKIPCTVAEYLEYNERMKLQKWDDDCYILNMEYTPFEKSLVITERVKIITLTSKS